MWENFNRSIRNNSIRLEESYYEKSFCCCFSMPLYVQ